MKSYNYDPSQITAKGKDQMRFELGDTMVEGKEMTCALCDEEYAAIIPTKIHTTRQWKKAKLACIESIFRRFSYEPDTKDGNLQLSLGDRAKLWKQMYDDLKAELKAGAASPDAIGMLAAHPVFGEPTQPYFWNGMMSHEEVEGRDI
jgi:hypothetical protein